MSDIAGEFVAVVIILMILATVAALWVWGMAWLFRKIRRTIRGGPNYRQIARLEREIKG
jgi:hypothetical protein